MAALLGRHGFRPVRDVRQRDMIPAAVWARTDSLRPVELSRIADAARDAAGRRGAGSVTTGAGRCA